MAGIKRVKYRSKDGKAKVKYYITFYDEYGKQRTSGKSYPTKSEAQYHLAEYKDRINDDLTIKQIFQYWQTKTVKYAQTFISFIKFITIRKKLRKKKFKHKKTE